MADQATTDPQAAENKDQAPVVGAIQESSTVTTPGDPVGAGLVPAQVEPEPTVIAEGQSPPEAVKSETAAETRAANNAGSPPAEVQPTPEQVRIAELEAALGAARVELEAVRDAQTLAAQLLTEKLGAAAARYRDLAAKSNPEIPAELIAGATIDQVDRSIEAGKTIVAKVRAQLAAQATSTITPGAPVRTGTDVEALSPLDKIKYAVAHRNARR